MVDEAWFNAYCDSLTDEEREEYFRLIDEVCTGAGDLLKLVKNVPSPLPDPEPILDMLLPRTIN
jgi:succinate dehydrogenase flavin-adding protein (antitoxin of CptAB toxin-antitoxin module)